MPRQARDACSSVSGGSTVPAETADENGLLTAWQAHSEVLNNVSAGELSAALVGWAIATHLELLSSVEHHTGICKGVRLRATVSIQVKTPPDARILKIREYEDRLAKIQDAVKVWIPWDGAYCNM